MLRRDIRAPNLGELYRAQAQTIATILDRQNNNGGVTATILSPGNAGLTEEKAKTYTAGIVLTPHWLRGFSASADYYSIKIDGAIGRLANQTICRLITCGAGGDITVITSPTLNLASLRTSGIDGELNYALPLRGLSASLPGKFTLRVLGTYVMKQSAATLGSPAIDRAKSTPFRLTVNLTYDSPTISVFLQERRIGPRQIDRTYTTSMIAANRIKPYWYTDVTFTLRPPRAPLNLEVFLSINNLFDREPPIGVTTGSVSGTPTILDTYDVIGRYVTAGVRLKL